MGFAILHVKVPGVWNSAPTVKVNLLLLADLPGNLEVSLVKISEDKWRLVKVSGDQ